MSGHSSHNKGAETVPVAAQALLCDLELFSRITVSHEGENPDENPDCGSVDTLETSDIDCLRVVAGKHKVSTEELIDAGRVAATHRSQLPK